MVHCDNRDAVGAAGGCALRRRLDLAVGLPAKRTDVDRRGHGNVRDLGRRLVDRNEGKIHSRTSTKPIDADGSWAHRSLPAAEYQTRVVCGVRATERAAVPL